MSKIICSIQPTSLRGRARGAAGGVGRGGSGAEHLHCNVFPNSPEPRTPGHTLLRIVPYTLRGIKKFADAVENDPELWQEVLDGDFDEGLRDRFERFAKHRASPPAR
jgi:hypothetical protein